ncbi:MAG: hypothetical protein ILP02_04630, partial [Clostridia bacterium]|nr:hypothetical protein [Clostridia bacterium]
SLIVYSVAAAAAIAVFLLLLFTSKKTDYAPNMIAGIAVAVVFGISSAWYFLNPFRDLKSLIALDKKLSSSIETRETGVVKSLDALTRDGLLLTEVVFLADGSDRAVACLPDLAAHIEVGRAYVFRIRANFIVGCDAYEG